MGKRYYGFLFGVYFLGLLVCGSARILLKLRFMDPETGFYTGSNGIITVYHLGLLAAAVLLFLVSRLRRPGGDYPVRYDNRAAGLLALLTGLSVAAYVLLDQPYPLMEQGYSQAILQARDYACVALGILAALSLVWIGAGMLFGSVSRAAMIPALFGGLWQAYMLVTRFNSYTVLTTISDNLLAVLFMVFAALFLVGQARVLFGLSRKDGRNYTIPSGLCASLTGLLLVVPNYLYMVLRDAAMPAPLLGMWESVYVLLLSLYALVFVVGMVRSIKQV